tara:strand:+ start:1119 stop:1508 length:390 start_codon:yes stop_codon:yes gene_type:complete
MGQYKTQPTTTGNKKATDGPKREVSHKIRYSASDPDKMTTTKVVKKKSGKVKERSRSVDVSTKRPAKKYRDGKVSIGVDYRNQKGTKKRTKKSGEVKTKEISYNRARKLQSKSMGVRKEVRKVGKILRK